MSIDNFLLSSNTTDLNYPEVRPTLDLNFARVKALDPRITFTRASGGSYVGADGLIKYAGVNEPRFDHDLSTGESLGLLVERNSNNLINDSENMSGWSANNTSLTTNTTETLSPYGTYTAHKLTATNSGVIQHTLYYYTGISNYNETAFSVWLKVASGSGNFQMNTGNVMYPGVIGGYFAVNDYLTVKYPNGWYRYIVNRNYGSTAGGIALGIHLNSNALGGDYGVVSPQSFEQSGEAIYIWGPQWETNQPDVVPTSYIPTVGSSRTRAADSVIMSGTNFTNWYNTTEGTFIFELNKTGYMSGYYGALFYVVDSYVRHEMYKQSGNSRITYQYGDLNLGIVYASLEITDGISSGKNIIFAHYKENDFGLGVNGIIKSTDNSGKSSVPFGSSNPYISFGSYNGSSEFWNAHIKKITYYPKRLTNQQLQVLTR